MSTLSSRSIKSPSRSPNPRRPETPTKPVNSGDSPTKEKELIDEPSRPTSTSRLVKKISQSESKTVDIAVTRSGSKIRKTISSRLSTPRANQMAPSIKEDVRPDGKKKDTETSKRSASTPKSLAARSFRSGTPSNKSSGIVRTSTPSNKANSSNKVPKASTPGNKNIDSTKPSKGPSVRKNTKSPTGSLSKKDSKDETKPASGGLSRAQKAEEKHRRRVTLAQDAAKGKGIANIKKSNASRSGLHRRSSISRAQSLAYIAKTRTARSSTQGFSNVEGDEAMAMADAIMGAIGTSKDDEDEVEGDDGEEEEDRVELMNQWQKKLKNESKIVSPIIERKPSSESDNVRMVKQSRILPSFAHMQGGVDSPPRTSKKQSPQALGDDPSKDNSSISQKSHETEEQITPRANRSLTTGGIGDDTYQKVVSNALKNTGTWERVRSAANNIATGRKGRSLSVATDAASRKGISWTFIDDAMEALSPSRKSQNHPQSPSPGSLSPQSPSPKSVEDSNEDSLVYQGWLQVHEVGSLFSTGWRRRYLMLIRGGRQGTGPRGIGSLLILRKEPTPTAIASLIKPNSSSEGKGGVVVNKDLCKEISLRGADLALHYEKVPAGTFGFLLTHTFGGDLPLTAPTREVRHAWSTELRNVLKRTNLDNGESDIKVDKLNSSGSLRSMLTPKDSAQWDRERSAVSMPRTPSSATSNALGRKSIALNQTIRSPLTSEITSPRNAPAKTRPDTKLQVDVFSPSDTVTTPVQHASSNESNNAPSSPSSPSSRLSFRGENRGNDRSRSAPSQRPPASPKTSLNSPSLLTSSSALQWRERMRRAAPARIEELDWDNLVAVATPDDFKDLGGGAGVSSVIVANTGGAVFFAFFRNRSGRHRTSDSSGNRSGSEATSNKNMLSKSISTVEELDEGESDDESSRTRSSGASQGGAIRSRVRAKNTLAKGPSIRSSRNSTDIEKLASFGDLDLDLEAKYEEDLNDSTIMEREEDEDSEEDENDESGVIDKGEVSDDEEDDFEEDLTEQVCILKFCRNLMDTQAEFCANQMAMALHIQVPSCRIMRKKDEEWDQIAVATFELRRDVEQDAWATSGCDALEESLHDTSCGLVFELVHTGCSLKLEHITSTLQIEKDREDESTLSVPATPSQPPTLLQMRVSSQSSSFMSDGEHSSRLTTASAVDALNLDPIRLGLPASTSFQSPPIATALTGGVFNHRRQTLISSGASLLSGSMRESLTDRVHSLEEENNDFREEYLEKAIGEIVGETLVFDIMIRNPDRFPCTGLGWRGNLDNVMWVERSPFSGTRTLWVIDSSIPRRPLRLHVRDDKTAIPNLIKQALLGECHGRTRPPIIHPDDETLVDISTRTTSCLLYSLVGGDPDAENDTCRRHLLLFDKQVPAFRRGIRRSLHRCRVLLEKSLHPLHTTLQNYFDEISIELESLAKKAKEKDELKQEKSPEGQNKDSFANVATAAIKKAKDEEKSSAKSRPGGGFRQRFNTGDVRMFNLKKEDREALEDSDEDTVTDSIPPPPPKVTPPSERLTPVISQMGRKWATEAKNRDRSGSKPLEMLRTEIPKPEEKTEITERDATVIVINNWTRKFWETGKALEARFEDYAIAQMDYEQQLLAASEQLTERQQELLDTAEVGDEDAGRDSIMDEETAARAASLAEAAAATTELMKHEPEPVFVTGFIDSGSTNCFAGAYELKIRLEHVNNRLRILFKTLDEIGDEDEEWES